MVAEKLNADKSTDNNLTISTKLSTDQLICKSPQTSSPEGSVKDIRQVIPLKDEGPVGKKGRTPMALYFGVLQILFGLLMTVFGVLVLVNEASLSQIGGGLWGGCIATFTGLLGVLSTAQDCCPLKTSPRRLVLTSFLALSLVSLAIAHLTLALTAIGLARDANKTPGEELVEDLPSDSTPLDLPHSYPSMLSSAGLIFFSICECICAALSAWHCARVLCPCFRQPQGTHEEDGLYVVQPPASLTAKDVMVSSWLGKHQQPVYVVATNHRTKRGTPIPVTQMYPIPTPPPSLLAPPVMGYPLIPAPLGTTPPPILHSRLHHAPEKIHKKRRRFPSDRHLQKLQNLEKPKKQKKPREKQKTISEAEVVKTYTGLDRIIAEEFIEICDSSKNTSSESSGCTSSETMSNEFTNQRL